MKEQLGSDKEGVKILLDNLLSHGVRHVVLSPGSRNVPLLLAVLHEPRLKHYVVVDERSAAFFALGLAQWTGQTAVLVCTSGTALLNYAPAVAEAYYQRIPLLVVSADRPVAWVDQDDSQTIRQRGILQSYVKASYEVPGEVRDDEDRWYANRTINEALLSAMRGRRGPVHLNMPMREPLYGTRQWPADYHTRTMQRVERVEMLPQDEKQLLQQRWASCPKIMVIAACCESDSRLQQALSDLGEQPNVVVLSETPANAGSGRQVRTIDRVLATVSEEERDDYAPELLVTFGGPLISRHVKAFLRSHRPAEHWQINRSEQLVDTFQVLTRQIDMEPGAFLSDMVPAACASDYAARWQHKKELAQQRHEAFARQVPWCDWKAFSILLPTIPEGAALQLANSTPIRYHQLFETPQLSRVNANRGVSGIDGATSTAVGAAVLNEGLTVMITGDLSFLYDSNALWNNYITTRFKLIVIRNGGGNIFRFIQGEKRVEELDECFDLHRPIDLGGFAALHGFAFFTASDEAGLTHSLPQFWQEDSRPALLEIDTTVCDSAVMLRAYFKALSKEI